MRLSKESAIVHIITFSIAAVLVLVVMHLSFWEFGRRDANTGSLAVKLHETGVKSNFKKDEIRPASEILNRLSNTEETLVEETVGILKSEYNLFYYRDKDIIDAVSILASEKKVATHKALRNLLEDCRSLFQSKKKKLSSVFLMALDQRVMPIPGACNGEISQ